MPGRSSSKSPAVRSNASASLPRVHSPLGPSMNASTYSQVTPASQSTFFSTVKDGFALGVGSSIGHRVVNSLFGSSASNASSQPCSQEKTSFDTCIQERKAVDECQMRLDALNKCIDNSK